MRFLFLPPEHDPDSYVRELGPAAFEQLVVQAVPLSRQLIEQAAQDADLATAEGRARMLAQAKPLWAALPDGALKRQLLPELARQAQLPIDDLSALWGQAATAQRNGVPARGSAGPATGAAPWRRPGRRAPAALADLALRLLLRHSDWWERLGADDHELLHALGGSHGAAVAWLEQQLTEHGYQTWDALDKALDDAPFHIEARAWVNAAAADEEQGLDDLRRVVQRLAIEQLGSKAEAAARDGDLPQLRALRQQIDQLKKASASTASA